MSRKNDIIIIIMEGERLIVPLSRRTDPAFLNAAVVFYRVVERVTSGRAAVQRVLLISPRGVLYVCHPDGRVTHTLHCIDIKWLRVDKPSTVVMCARTDSRQVMVSFRSEHPTNLPLCGLDYFVKLVQSFAPDLRINSDEAVKAPLELVPAANMWTQMLQGVRAIRRLDEDYISILDNPVVQRVTIDDSVKAGADASAAGVGNGVEGAKSIRKKRRRASKRGGNGGNDHEDDSDDIDDSDDDDDEDEDEDDDDDHDDHRARRKSSRRRRGAVGAAGGAPPPVIVSGDANAAQGIAPVTAEALEREARERKQQHQRQKRETKPKSEHAAKAPGAGLIDLGGDSAIINIESGSDVDDDDDGGDESAKGGASSAASAAAKASAPAAKRLPLFAYAVVTRSNEPAVTIGRHAIELCPPNRFALSADSGVPSASSSSGSDDDGDHHVGPANRNQTQQGKKTAHHQRNKSAAPSFVLDLQEAAFPNARDFSLVLRSGTVVSASWDERSTEGGSAAALQRLSARFLRALRDFYPGITVRTGSSAAPELMHLHQHVASLSRKVGELHAKPGTTSATAPMQPGTAAAFKAEQQRALTALLALITSTAASVAASATPKNKTTPSSSVTKRPSDL